jgi:uncharacterized membrane protein YcaP (DUF421 family)
MTYSSRCALRRRRRTDAARTTCGFLAPVVLIDDSKSVERNLKRQRLCADDVAEEMRLQQIMSFDDVRWAILEANGRIGFIEKKSADAA